jgi:hypothetical protein
MMRLGYVVGALMPFIITVMPLLPTIPSSFFGQAYAQYEESLFTGVALNVHVSGGTHFEDQNSFVHGDTAHFDAMALIYREDEPLDGFNEGLVFELEIIDQQKNTVFRKALTTDRDGRFNFSFPITDEMSPGRYELKYSSTEMELLTDTEFFYVVPRDSDFTDLSGNHTLSIALDGHSIKYGESSFLNVELCPPVNFASIAEGFIDPTTGERMSQERIVMVFELELRNYSGAKHTETGFLKATSCEGKVELRPDFFPAPGEWSVDVTARWLGNDGILYQVASTNPASIRVDSSFASYDVSPVRFVDIKSGANPLDWSNDRSITLVEYDDNLALVSSDTGRTLRLLVNASQMGQVTSDTLVNVPAIRQAQLSPDSNSVYFLTGGELHVHDFGTNNTVNFPSLGSVNYFDLTSDGRIIYSTPQGFWIADAELENSTRFQNLRTDQHSSFDASADGRYIVLSKDNKWVTIETSSGKIADVPRHIDPLGCGENSLITPNGEMVLISSTFCAYRGGVVDGFISIAALDGSFEEFIVPTGNGVPHLLLVSNDGNHIMLSGEYQLPDAPNSDHGLYTMSLARSIPEFGVATTAILVTLILTVVIGMKFRSLVNRE